MPLGQCFYFLPRVGFGSSLLASAAVYHVHEDHKDGYGKEHDHGHGEPAGSGLRWCFSVSPTCQHGLSSNFSRFHVLQSQETAPLFLEASPAASRG